MNLLNKFFGKKEAPINSYEDFWKWFQMNERSFLKVLQKRKNIEKGFFNKLSPKLGELREGFSFLAGIEKDGTAELILTADGEVRNIVFVEELVVAAPKISGWKFTALKPESDISDFSIGMFGYNFDKDNLFFYENEKPNCPDEIELTILHKDLNDENKEEIEKGTYIFLDNLLGELMFVTTIDFLIFESIKNAKKDLIPIEKLKSFLKWRQKEFIEKYEGTRYDTENDMHTTFSGEMKDGNPRFAIMNSELLQWDKKASHEWIMTIEIEYEGDESGLPDENMMHLMDELEDEIDLVLKDSDGYLNVGQHTAENIRQIYFACKEFRKSSKVVDKFISENVSTFEINFDIRKDKYWQRFNRFLPR